MTLFFVQEEERPILPDRPANLAAVAVVPPLRLRNLQSIPNPVVGVQFVILVVPITRAVPVIGASLRNHLYFGPARTREISSGVIGCYAKLFQALHGSGNHGTRRCHEASVVSAPAFH